MYDIGMLRWMGGAVVVFAVVLGVVAFAHRSPAEAVPEAALAPLAFAALLAAPGVLTILAEAHPALLVTVGVILVPLSMLSLAGVLLPLLVPAVFAFVAYARRRREQPPPFMPAAVTTVVVLVCLAGAVMALLAHADPREYRTATGGGGTSDVVTWAESLLCLLLVAVAVGVAEVLSRPVPRGPG